MSKNKTASPRNRRGRRRSGVEVVWARHLEVDPEEGMPILGRKAIKNIKEDGAAGRKGNDRKMPDLSTRYEVKKLKEGGSPLPDLMRTGRLWSQFHIVNKGRDFVEIGFNLVGANDIKKWRKLKKQGRNPLGLSKKDIRQFAKDLIKRGLLKKVNGPPDTKRKR